jgi:tetratricopeptide (TPR) repeat protein
MKAGAAFILKENRSPALGKGAAMLERLDEVNWAELNHAYGSAEAVPDMLRTLLVEDADARHAALSALYDCLCHQQMTVQEATAPAVPFLVEILEGDSPADKPALLYLLGHMVQANSYLETHGLMFPPEEQAKPEFAEQREMELSWVRQTRTEVWQGLPVYLTLVHEADSTLRRAAAFVLSALLKQGRSEIPDPMLDQEPLSAIALHLSEQFQQETNPAIRADFLFALEPLPENLAAYRPPLEELLSASQPQERLAAALVLVRTQNPPPAAALDVLLQALTHHASTDKLFPESRWMEMKPRFAVIDALCRLGMAQIDLTLPALLQGLQAGSSYSAEFDAGPVLRLVFGTDRVPDGLKSAMLTDPQRQVLQTIAENPQFWRGVSNGEFELLKMGLPDSRLKLRQLCQGTAQMPHLPSTNRHDAQFLLDRCIAETVPLTSRSRKQDNAYDAAVADMERRERLDVTEKHRRRVRRLILTSVASDPMLALLTECPHVQLLALNKSDITNAGLPHLSVLKELRVLSLAETAVTDEGLRRLPLLPQLRKLDLLGLALTDAGLSSLQGLLRLEYLNLSHTQISAPGLEALSLLPRLRILWLAQTRVDDAALEVLTRFPALERLELYRCQISDDGLAALKKMRLLKILGLAQTPVTDAGMRHLAEISTLRKLDLDDTLVTDAGLRRLRKLKKLRELSVANTAITYEAIDAFKEEVRRCRVVKEGYDRPQTADDFNARAAQHYFKGERAEAIAHHLEALRLAPKDPATMNYLAWIWATSPEDEIRDGERALEYAQRACELTEWQNAAFLDTLAAACAEEGQFDQAIRHAQQAIRLNPEEKDDYHRRLEMYRLGQPYRTSEPS